MNNNIDPPQLMKQSSNAFIDDIENTDFVAQQQRNAQLEDYREMQRRKYEARSASKNVIEPIGAPLLEEEKESSNGIMNDRYDNATEEEIKEEKHPWD